MEPVDLSELVREMSHLLEVAISKKVVLRFDLARGMPSLQVDATQVRQVVMNLVINASEAIGDRSGVVALSTGIMECAGSAAPGVWMLEPPTTGCCAYFDVADTGCGMDANTLARIFDPFFSTKFTGRGLGLAAVLGIVRGHGGGLRVASEVGKGTTFRVALPVSDVPAAAVETSGEAVRWRSSGTVLVVDDEETVRVLAKLMLTRLGFQVLTAVDGRDAVATFGRQAEAIRCVILDVTMPHMDGVETLLALRAIRADVPILLSSGYTEQDVAMRAAAHEVSGFVQKPYTLKALAAKLRQALEPVQT
jgi:CheY-like chemotaxis protein